MQIENIERIHQKYENHMGNYQLVGSYSVHIPFIKTILRMKFTYETQLSLIEEFICRCIDQGVKDMNDIGKVLYLESEMLEVAATPLLKQGYLEMIEDYSQKKSLGFTEEGIKLFQKRSKEEPKTVELEWFFDALSAEYNMEFFGNEAQHSFKAFEQIEKDTQSIVLNPIFIPTYVKERDYSKLSQKVIEKIDFYSKGEHSIDAKRIIQIDDFEPLRNREIYYHEYRILVYKNGEQQYKLIAHDPCGLDYIDQNVTKSIIKLYEAKKFDELLEPLKQRDEGYKSAESIVEALENYALNLMDAQDDPVVAEKINEIEQLKTETFRLQYIMNYKIREYFLKYLKEAETSLYIISPWMNNYIINSSFKKNLVRLLKKGVKIRIIYGISEADPQKMESKDLKTKQLAEELEKLAKPFGELFKITHGQTHEKLLICDDKYYINGSFNFLSYAGEDEKFFRNEGSTYSEDPSLIEKTIKLRFDF